MASRREFLKGSVSAAALSGCSTLMPTQAADTLIVNGRIATLDPKNPNAEAIAIRGERIVEVGNPGELEKYRGPNTRVIDAGRRIVIFSGGGTKGSDAVYDEVRAIRDGGGFGSIIGRNAFQRPWDEALDFLGRIMAIYEGSEA